MGWDEVFEELGGDLAARQVLWAEAERAAQERAERAVVDLVRRLRAHVGEQLTFEVGGHGTWCGTVLEVGRGWLCLAHGAAPRGAGGEPGPGTLVNLEAVDGVRGLGGRAAPEHRGPVPLLGLSVPLRRFTADTGPVRVHRADGSVLVGTVAHVGADHLELVEHPVDEPSWGMVRPRVVVPLHRVSLVRPVASR